MKKLAKKLLVLVVAICATFGMLTFAGGLPFWFGGGLMNSPAWLVPNANINVVSPWAQLLNGGVFPFGNQLGGVSLAQANANVMITENAANPGKPIVAPFTATIGQNGKVKWRNNSTTTAFNLVPQTNNFFPLTNLAPGGTFTHVFPVAGIFEYSVENAQTPGLMVKAKVKVLAPAGGAGAGTTTVAPGGPNANIVSNIVIKNGSVQPLLANIPQNATVTWENATGEPRMIVSQNGLFSTTVAIAPGGTFVSPVFNAVGMFKYTVKNTLNANDIFSGGVNVFAALPVGGGTTVTSATGGAVPPGVTPQQSVTVKIMTTALDPVNVHLVVGGKVTWENKTNTDVKIMATGMASGLFTTLIPVGGTYTFTFTHPIVGLTYETSGSLVGKVNVY
ncbi:MAG: hypothetical protein M3Q34_02590 [bacterium]|nr:hypothetical protein [bacterium]